MKRMVISDEDKRIMAMIAGGLGLTESQLLNLVTSMLQTAFDQSEMNLTKFKALIEEATKCIAKTEEDSK